MISRAARYESLVASVARTLLVEAGYSMHQIRRAEPSELRKIIQHLLVMRAPPREMTTSEGILYAEMDEILALEQSRVALTDARELPTLADALGADATANANAAPVLRQLALWKGDITSLRATAIVNAANSRLLGCFQPPHRCIDNVIHCKAGPRLRTVCAELMRKQAHEEANGQAKITPGFALPSDYVIHTVGPQLHRGQQPTAQQRRELQACYTSSLDALLRQLQQETKPEKIETESEESKARVTIAFPCISTGLFAFPSELAVELAIEAVTTWLGTHARETASWTVVFNTFLQSDFDLYRAHLERLHAPLVLPTGAGPNPNLHAALARLQRADYLLITAGAGLSAAAGLDYTSPAVMQKFHPTVRRVLPSFRTMYNSIGFTGWAPELMWGYLFRQISIARFDWVRHRTAPTYPMLRALQDNFERRAGDSTFVKTSNADGMFEQEGFPMDKFFAMQGEYGRIQCKRPCRPDSIFDVRPFMRRALESFNPATYEIEDPAGIPQCPHCSGPMFLLLRVDNSFMESALAEMKAAHHRWLTRVLDEVQHHGKRLVILEFGVGFNTPGVLRLPNERLAARDGIDLIRINQEHPELPFEANGVELAADANEVLRFFCDKLGLEFDATTTTTTTTTTAVAP